MKVKHSFSGTWGMMAFFIWFSTAYGSPGKLSKVEDLQWINIKTLEVQGRGWESEEDFFGRLPSKAEEMVPSSVWRLSKHTSGMFVKFKTNASILKVKWDLTQKNLSMPHFAATGVSGVDLYVKTGKKWHWLSVGRPEQFPDNEAVFFEEASREEREYLLYLPLYNGIENLWIGIPVEAQLKGIEQEKEKPIVFYGTSITQGGCASRAGMSTTAILGRMLNREIINLGFSGSGRMEPALAHLLAELEPALFFIDCLPNLQAQEVAERVEPFVEILRESHPETPIVLAEGITYENAFFVDKQKQRNLDSRKALRNAYENLLNKGYRNVYYQVGEGQLGFDGEGTVDGTHPTDLGFWRQAQAYQPIIETVLQNNSHPTNTPDDSN